MKRIVYIIGVLLLLSSCKSWQYVPPTKRSAKKALERTVERYNKQKNRIKAITFAYPSLPDTVFVERIIRIEADSIYKTDTIRIQDTGKVDSLVSVIEDLVDLTVSEDNEEVRERIKWLVREVQIESEIADTSLTLEVTRDLNIGDKIVPIESVLIIGIVDGKLFHELHNKPINEELVVEAMDSIKFDVRRLPGILKIGLIIIGIVIVGVLIYFVVTIAKKYLP